MNKKELRETIRQRKLQFRQDRPTCLSPVAVDKVASHPRVANAHTMLLYHALPDEVDTTCLLRRFRDKMILLPKVIDSERMQLRLYTGEGDLAEGFCGIKEPTGEVFTDLAKIDVAIVPGMAFDMKGHRLGRGKGYYDRLLAEMPETYKIGLCFDFQFFDSIPFDRHDVKMDEVISI